MAERRNPPEGLPLRRSLRPLYVSSSIIVLFVAAASLGGLLGQSTFYPTRELLQAFLSNDVASLFIGLPMLLGSMWLAKRGKLLGLLLWPGALLYFFYNDMIYTLGLPFGAAFLLHLVPLTLGLYALPGLLASIHPQAVKEKLDGAVPARLAGGILAGLGFLFFLRALGVIGMALLNQTALGDADLALNAVDFLVSPAWVICGVLLRRRNAFGFMAGLGMLFHASMSFIGLIVVLLLQPLLIQAPLALFDVVVVFVMGMVCFIPLGLYVRGVVGKSTRE